MDVFDLAAKITLDSSSFERSLSAIGGSLKAFTGISAAAVGTAVAGVSALTKQSIDSYASYEQLVGGVDTLFKDSSLKVQQYAADAYKTAGLSANEYMETVTSFSASLLQSLEGDTERAADVADVAIRDMSDNANKMGTAMESIQNAYQGFAKQNYTMLDNLKLGYGGTKAEMERLLADANELNEKQGIYTDYQIENYADIVEAIHVVQSEMGITGTTASEAASTIEGSMSSLRASWSNLLTEFGKEDSNANEILDNFIASLETAANNIIPRIVTVLGGIGTAIEHIAPVIAEEIPKLAQEVLPSLLAAATGLVNSFAQAVETALPSLVSSIAEALPGVIEAIKNLASSLLPAIQNAVTVLMDNLPEIVGTLGSAIAELAPMLINTIADTLIVVMDGLIETAPVLLESLTNIITGVMGALTEKLPVIIPKLFEFFYGLLDTITSSDLFGEVALLTLPLLTAIAEGLIAAAPTVYKQIPKIISNVFDTITTYMDEHGDEWVDQLETFITTLIDGVIELTPQLLEGLWAVVVALVDGVSEYIPVLVERIKNFFGIESFSESGQNIIDGILGAIKGGVESVKSGARDIFNAVIDWFNQLPDRAGVLWGQVLGHIAQWAVDAPQKAKEAAENLFNNVVEWVQRVPDKVHTLLNDTLPKVVDWGLNLMEKGKIAAKDLFDSIVNKVSELPGKMVDIGYNIVTGIWDGIASAKEWLSSKISGFADGVVSGFQESFKISSPSKVMRDSIGKFLAEGIGVGFTDEIDSVTRNMASALEQDMDTDFVPDVNLTGGTSRSAGTIGNIVINNTIDMSGVKIASEMDIDDVADGVIEKLSEKLEMLDIYNRIAIGGGIA